MKHHFMSINILAIHKRDVHQNAVSDLLFFSPSGFGGSKKKYKKSSAIVLVNYWFNLFSFFFAFPSQTAFFCVRVSAGACVEKGSWNHRVQDAFRWMLVKNHTKIKNSSFDKRHPFPPTSLASISGFLQDVNPFSFPSDLISWRCAIKLNYGGKLPSKKEIDLKMLWRKWLNHRVIFFCGNFAELWNGRKKNKNLMLLTSGQIEKKRNAP